MLPPWVASPGVPAPPLSVAGSIPAFFLYCYMGFAYMGHMQHLFVHASWWLFSLFDYMLSIEVATLDTSRGLPV